MAKKDADNRSRGAPMNEAGLIALIEQYESDCLGSPTAAGAAVGTTLPGARSMTTLSVDRYSALEAFYGRADVGGTGAGVVIPEIRQTLEWELAQLMRIFTAGQVCQFDPQGPDDMKPAQLETAAVQHIFMHENHGFLLIHDALHDARLLRNGYGRVMVEKITEPETTSYTGLTQLELAMVLSDTADEKLEVLEQNSYLVDMPVNAMAQAPGQVRPPPMTVYDVKVRRTKTKTRIRIDAMPPEEMLVHTQCPGSLDEALFIQHHSWPTRTELIEDGYDEAIINKLPAEVQEMMELVPLARTVVTDQLAASEPTDKSAQTICKRDIIMRVDYDGDGVAERRHIVLGHRTVLLNEEIDECPYVGGATTRMPHRHTGLSAYDDLWDIQAIKTDLTRGLLDNARLVNNPRMAVDWKHASLDDFMTMRDGGILRTDGPPGEVMMSIELPFVGDKILPILDHIDTWREMRTGIGKDTVGLDADALQNVTKGGVLAGMQAASLKLELKARFFAETFVAPLFCKIHSAMRKHMDQPMMFQLRGQWVQVDPSRWGERTSVSPAVGLGSGQREEMRQNMVLLAQAQQQLMQALMGSPPPVYKCAWNTFVRVVELLGINTPEQFGMDPDSKEYAQLQQQMAQQHAQMAQGGPMAVQQLKNQGQLQLEQAKMQTAAVTQNAETQRQMAKLNSDIMAQQDQRAHEVGMQARDHAMDANQASLDRQQSAVDTRHNELLQLAKILAPIISQQLKGTTENAGEVLAADAKAAQAGISGQLSQHLANLTQILAQPRVATLPDGRQVMIQ